MFLGDVGLRVVLRGWVGNRRRYEENIETNIFGSPKRQSRANFYKISVAIQEYVLRVT